MDSFIPFGYTMAILIFGFVVYLVLSMPTKRDLRKATHPDADSRRSALLKNTSCLPLKFTFAEAYSLSPHPERMVRSRMQCVSA